MAGVNRSGGKGGACSCIRDCITDSQNHPAFLGHTKISSLTGIFTCKHERYMPTPSYGIRHSLLK